MAFLKLTEQNVQGKTVLIHVDMNMSLKDGKISDDTRIRTSFVSIRYYLDNGVSIIVTTHLGRPAEGELYPEDDVVPVAAYLDSLLGRDMKVSNDWHKNKPVLNAGDVVMLQNVCINKGEKENDLEPGKAYAALRDAFANDALNTVHRAQASTEAVAQAVPVTCTGVLTAGEPDALGETLKQPVRPTMATVAGNKVSTKLTILKSLASKIDQPIVGGGIANTLLLAEGKTIGKLLVEHDLAEESKKIMTKIAARGNSVPLPIDVVVVKALAADAEAVVKDIANVAEGDMTLSIGSKSAAVPAGPLKAAGMVVWDGPVGVLEFDQLTGGTKALAETIVQSRAFSTMGDGDTLTAIAKFNATNQTGYISTGGGVFLEFLEGKELPIVAALEKRGA